MKIFLDSADIEEIKDSLENNLIDGVTTNPSLIKKASKKYGIKDLDDYIKKLLRLCKNIPVSLEVIGTNFDEMKEQGILLHKKFNRYSRNVVVKIPVNPCMEKKCERESDGIKAIKYLSKKGIKVNCTLVFTPEQALLASKSGAKYVSPFVGRVDDYLREIARVKFDKNSYFSKDGIKKKGKIIEDFGIYSGVNLIEETAKIFEKEKKKAEILASSIRNKRQLREVIDAGADVATIPYKVLKSLLNHPKTKEGMKNFTKDIVPEYREIFEKR